MADAAASGSENPVEAAETMTRSLEGSVNIELKAVAGARQPKAAKFKLPREFTFASVSEASTSVR
jgi:hypothetical protein